jgi:fibronectin type 3 domain-containing protein
MRFGWIPSLLLLLGCTSSASGALGTPSNLTAAAASTTSVRLTWVDNNRNPTEDGFTVERSLAPTSGFVVVGTVGSNATSYLNAGLVTGTTYYYRVRAVRAQQSSGYSNVASATPCDVTPPSVPIGLAYAVVSCSEINLSWASSFDGESGVGSYRVYRNNVFVRQVTAPTTSVADTGLAASTAYTYQVSAVDNAGNESARSASVTGVTPVCGTTTIATTSTTSTTVVDLTAPSVPASLTAAPASCSQVNLSWLASTDTGGSGLGGYRVYRNNAFVKQVAPTATTTSDTGLAASTLYSYQVSAVDNAGNESARSVTASTNTPACTSGGAHLWSRRQGGSAYADIVLPVAIAVDRNGNSAVVGSFAGTVDLGGGPLVASGTSDMFVAVYTPSGTHLWSRRMGGIYDDYGTAVGFDASGNVFVAGRFAATITFGGTNLTSAGGHDIGLAKYSATGAHQWSKRFGSTSWDEPTSLAVDGSGNVLVAGQYAGSVDFGGGPLASAGSFDGFLAKYTAAGAYAWAKRLGGTSADMVTALGVDASGNPTLVGYFSGTTNFGGANLTSAGSNDIVVARYTAAGAHQWSARFGGAAEERAYGAAVDGAGNVALTGYFTGSFGFGGATLVNAAGADIFLAKLSANGAHVWSKQFGTGYINQGEIGEAVAIDPVTGDVTLTGEIVGDVNFGGIALAAPTFTADVFVARFSSAGGHKWSKRFVGNWDDHGMAVAFDPSGNEIIAGDFAEAVSFGGALLTSPGKSDGFVVKLGP